MKRDMDLVRQILIDAEEQRQTLESYTPEQVAYHVALMIDAGLVDARISCNGKGIPYRSHVIRLTWQGHDFLEGARNPKIWKAALEKAGTLGLQAIGPCIVEIAKAMATQA